MLAATAISIRRGYRFDFQMGIAMRMRRMAASGSASCSSMTGLNIFRKFDMTFIELDSKSSKMSEWERLNLLRLFSIAKEFIDERSLDGPGI